MILEALGALSPLPLVLLIATLVLVILAGSDDRRWPAATAPLLAELAPFALAFAASVAFLRQTPRAEPELIRLAAGIGQGTAALLWSTIVVAIGLVLVNSKKGLGGSRTRIHRLLFLAAGAAILFSFGLAAWSARSWLYDLGTASWLLVLMAVGLSFTV